MEPISTSILILLVILTSFLVYREKYPSGVIIKDPPILKLEQGKPIAMTGFPANIPMTGIPANIPMTGIPANIPMTGIPANIPLSNVPKNIELITPSSIPLKAEPLLVNYGPSPQLKLADIPPLQFGQLPTLYIKNSPCDGISDTYRNIGSDCMQHMWSNAGCLTKIPYDDWIKRQNKARLQQHANWWASVEDSNVRKGCYGDDWATLVPAKLGEVIDNKQHGWRYCGKCGCLQIGIGDGKCAAGGTHTLSSLTYIAPVHVPPTDGAVQMGWKWCKRCSCMTWNGNNNSLGCPAGVTGGLGILTPNHKKHDFSSSADYGMYTVSPTSGQWQDGWKYCNKCGIMHYKDGASVCGAGGAHTNDGTYWVAHMGFGV
jgi:hypothetical protein